MVELIPTVLRQKVGSALAQKLSDDDAFDIAFHITDWNGELAFLCALYLFPEEFSSEEIMEGVEALLIHAPNHLAAAAQLLGYPVTDVFESGVTPWPEQRNFKPKNEI